MCFVLLMQVAVAPSAAQEGSSTVESCSAGDSDCFTKTNVLIQTKVVAAHSADGSDDCERGDWKVDYWKYGDSMTLVVLVEIDGKRQDEGTLAAFIDGEVRGVQAKPLPPPFGPNKGAPFYNLMVHADGSEKDKPVTYKFMACDGTITELDYDAKYDFKVNAHYGNVVNDKIAFKCRTAVNARNVVSKINKAFKGGTLPTCQDDEAAMKKAMYGFGCQDLKAYCIGFAEHMKKHCKATCKGTFPELKKIVYLSTARPRVEEGVPYIQTSSWAWVQLVLAMR